MSSLRHVLVTSVPALTSDTHRSMRQCQQSLINRSPGAGAATHPWEMYCDVVVTTVRHSTAQYGTVQRPLYAIQGWALGGRRLRQLHRWHLTILTSGRRARSLRHYITNTINLGLEDKTCPKILSIQSHRI